MRFLVVLFICMHSLLAQSVYEVRYVILRSIHYRSQWLESIRGISIEFYDEHSDSVGNGLIVSHRRFICTLCAMLR